MRILKLLGLVVAGLVMLAVIAVLFVFWKSNAALKKTYVVEVGTPSLPDAPEALARGAHLAVTRGCSDCHAADFGGGRVVDDSALGRVYGPNLTTGRGGVVSDYTDADWVRAIRHGVNPDGRGLFIMPSDDYMFLSEGDMAALIAHLKSLPPVDRDSVPIKLGPVGRVLVATGKLTLAAARIEHASLKPMEVTPDVTAEYGHYVAMSCIGCHGPTFSGGPIPGAPPEWPPARNLTPDPTGRLASWTEEDFLSALRTGKSPDGAELNSAMPRAFGLMTDIELRALWVYLKTLPPVPAGSR